MRKLLLTAVLLAAGGPAFASSIELAGPVSSENSSIIEMKCATCVAPKVIEDPKAYKVPHIAPGTQAAEIVDINGQKRLKRAEAWLGGSPVVFISSAEGWSTDGSRIAAAATVSSDGIDMDAKTAAVPGAGPVSADTASMTGTGSTKVLDVTTFELRLY